jgi:hypothetical protein
MERSESQKRENDEKIARGDLFGGITILHLEGSSLALIRNHAIDYFVSQSRGNESIEEVYFDLYGLPDDNGDDVWDKIG